MQRCVLLSVSPVVLPGRIADSTLIEGRDYLKTSRDSKEVCRRKWTDVPVAVDWSALLRYKLVLAQNIKYS